MKMYRGLIFFMVMVARLFTYTLGKLQLDCTRWVAPALPPSQHRSTLRLRGGETQSEKEAQIRQAVKAAVAARMDAANHGDTYQDDGPRPEQDHRKKRTFTDWPFRWRKKLQWLRYSERKQS